MSASNVNGPAWCARLPSHSCQCPDCGGVDFFEGPHGGLSVNVKCAKCGSKFCWSPLGDMMPIDNEDQLYKGLTIRLADLYNPLTRQPGIKEKGRLL